MRISKTLCAIALAFVIVSGVLGTGQAQESIQQEPFAEHETKVRDMVSFLEYVLNTLGNRSTSARDKDVIINESYTKIFRDSKVQIEDDLDENRDVVTNKDVQAYLKDVDFFFRSVNFDFNIEDISHYVNEKGELFFKVTLTRNLRGIGIEGDSINNTKKRFIEINLDPEAQDLKIASIYTNIYSRAEALARWWDGLSYEWKNIFILKAGLTDSVTQSDIKNITEIEELDLSGHQYIVDLSPLSQLTNLRRLNISGTNISDLKPIRNLTKLEELNISESKVDSLEPLKYASALRFLELQNTPVTNIETMSRLFNLQSLDISSTNISDLGPLAELEKLKVLKTSNTPLSDLMLLSTLESLIELDVSSTQVSTLDPLATLSKLQILKADSTPVASVESLREAASLTQLSINHTLVSTLAPLSDLEHLERIYCDFTKVTTADAGKFMEENPEVLVIFESEDLKNWWIELPIVWKNVFVDSFNIKAGIPSKEKLAKITAIDSLNLSGNTYIQNISPLNKLRELKILVVRNSSVTDLDPLEDLRNIEYLDISGNPVTDFQPLRSLTNLKVFKANNTNLSYLDDVMELERLTELELDNTLVSKTHVMDFLDKHPASQVIFRSEDLSEWYEALPPAWKNIFETQVPMSAVPTRQQLHRLTALEAVKFSDAPVNDLQPLTAFLRLREIRFSGTGISDLSPLVKFSELEVLQASRSPIKDISPARHFKNLQVLDISNTPVKDLEPVAALYNLRELNCSGTQVSKLKDLGNLSNLTVLDCSNTRVRRLDRIDHLDLKALKCYNTRISARKIENFKGKNEDCIVTYY